MVAATEIAWSTLRVALTAAATTQERLVLSREPRIGLVVDHVQQRDFTVIGHGTVHLTLRIHDLRSDEAGIAVLLERNIRVVAVNLWSGQWPALRVEKDEGCDRPWRARQRLVRRDHPPSTCKPHIHQD